MKEKVSEILLGTLVISIVILSFGVVIYAMAVGETETTEAEEKVEVVHAGKCLEYKTEYKLDCGLFVSKDSFCAERKYDICVRWEEE